MGSALFFLTYSLSRWQEYKPSYVKVRAHYLLSWNYVVKRVAFEDTLLD
jgi:hypothetical protein